MFRLVCIYFALLLGAGQAWAEGDKAQVGQVLDQLHTAAAQADAESYFAQFLDKAIFLGTAAGERWNMAEFRAFAMPYFESGKAWTYVPTERHVVISADGQSAWFDELLHNEKYGLCRGSGVLLKTDNGWKIAQYHLTLPIPNEIAVDITGRLRQWRADHPAK